MNNFFYTEGKNWKFSQVFKQHKHMDEGMHAHKVCLLSLPSILLSGSYKPNQRGKYGEPENHARHENTQFQ